MHSILASSLVFPVKRWCFRDMGTEIFQKIGIGGSLLKKSGGEGKVHKGVGEGSCLFVGLFRVS